MFSHKQTNTSCHGALHVVSGKAHKHMKHKKLMALSCEKGRYIQMLYLD